MIEIVKKKKSKKLKDPYYKLVFNYMIGDADGQTKKEMTLGVEHADTIERFVKLINSLEPTNNTWGIVLDSYDFHKFLDEGQLNEEDYKWLKGVMFEDYDDDETTPLFWECVMGETEYSFLVFEGVSLFYYDEHGVKHKTRIK